MRCLALVASLLGLLLLSACASVAVMSSVPLSTMSRLSSLTLAEIDPGELRVAVRLPDGLEPRPLGVRVTIEVAGKERAVPGPHVLVLVPAAEPADSAPLESYRRTGTRLWIYRLSTEDAARLKRLMAAGDGGTGASIAAGVEACWRRPLGASPLPTTTLLRTGRTGYFVLADDLDLRRVVSDADFADRVPACSP